MKTVRIYAKGYRSPVSLIFHRFEQQQREIVRLTLEHPLLTVYCQRSEMPPLSVIASPLFILFISVNSSAHAFIGPLAAAATAIRRARNSNHPLKTARYEGYSIRDSWNLLVLGDLHLEDDMTFHEQAREDCITAARDFSLLATAGTAESSTTTTAEPNTHDKHNLPTVGEMLKEFQDSRAGDLTADQLEMLSCWKRDGELMKCHLVSLGDLGRKDIRHEPGDAGTTKSFLDAKQFLDGFQIPYGYDLVTGNHDLEGLDEFDTDEANLRKWMKVFQKSTPWFSRVIGEKTLLVGISTVRFRDAPFSSHEVHVDDEQLDWFVRTVQAHPEEHGWKVLIFSHAPIMGSGLRVLQNVHVMNGCAWMNHCSENRNAFIRTVIDNPQIKLWFSGHFHLSHDYEDAISTIGSCTFVQAGVIGPVSTRDGRRQTRFVQGSKDIIKIHSINHHIRDGDGKANVRLDCIVDLETGEVQLNGENQEIGREDWFQAYVPREEDGCYIDTPNGSVADAESRDSKVCWWHMADGKVIGLHQGQLVEYDSETLSPLGLVVPKEKLDNREVLVVEHGTALVLVDEHTNHIEVVHPNDDGSYWRKLQRNKRVRQEEKAREAVARMWLDKQTKQ